MEKLVLPPHYSVRLFRSSLLASGSSMVAYVYDHSFLCFWATIVLVCSINYWRHPIYSWRRTMDMCCAGLALSAHMYWARELEGGYLVFYGMSMILALGSYKQARYYGSLGRTDISHLYHISLHTWGNVCNVILYMGLRDRGISATFSNMFQPVNSL